jgi:hypothetical protein
MEVIVGLTVASLALAAGFTTLAFVGERARAAERATVEALEGAAGRMLLVDWLSGARLSSPYRSARFAFRFQSDRAGGDRGSASFSERRADMELIANWRGDFEGLDAEENALPSDEIVFPTTAQTPLHVPSSVVRLYIDVDPVTPERGLVAELTERPLDTPRRVELLPQVVHMEILYLPDVEGGVDDVEWSTSWIARDGLPKAVEITLTAASGDSLPPLLQFPIRVPLGTLR